MSSLIDCIESGFQTHLPQSLAIGPLHFFARNPAMGFLQGAVITPIIIYGMKKLLERATIPQEQLSERQMEISTRIKQVAAATFAAISGYSSAIMVIAAFNTAFNLGCGGAYSATPIYSAIPTP